MFFAVYREVATCRGGEQRAEFAGHAGPVRSALPDLRVLGSSWAAHHSAPLLQSALHLLPYARPALLRSSTLKFILQT